MIRKFEQVKSKIISNNNNNNNSNKHESQPIWEANGRACSCYCSCRSYPRKAEVSRGVTKRTYRKAVRKRWRRKKSRWMNSEIVEKPLNKLEQGKEGVPDF